MSVKARWWIGLLVAATATVLACPVALAQDPAPPITTTTTPAPDPPPPKPDPAPAPAPQPKAKPKPQPKAAAAQAERSAPAPVRRDPAPAYTPPAYTPPAYTPPERSSSSSPARSTSAPRAAPRRSKPERKPVRKRPQQKVGGVKAARASLTKTTPVAVARNAAPEPLALGGANLGPEPPGSGRSSVMLVLLAGLLGLAALLLGLSALGPVVAPAVRLDVVQAQRAASTLGAGAVVALSVSLGLLVAYVIS